MDPCCSVCLESLVGSKSNYSAPCGHVYHFSCIKKWLSMYFSLQFLLYSSIKLYNSTRSPTCPECRAPSNLQNISRIFFNFDSTVRGIKKQSEVEERLDRIISSLTHHKMKMEREIGKLQQEILERQRNTFLCLEVAMGVLAVFTFFLLFY